MIYLPLGEVREHGKGQSVTRDALADGKITRPIPQRGVRLLQVQRHGIVESRLDPCALERAPHAIPLIYEHDVEVVDVPGRWHLLRQHDASARKTIGVPPGHPPSRLVPALESPQLDAQDGRLQGVEPRVAALSGYVNVALLLPVVSQHPTPLRNRSIRGRDRTGFAHGPQILPRIEAECRSVSEGPTPGPAVLRTVRLAGVLDDLEVEFPGQLQ